jgi:hypothetical protein
MDENVKLKFPDAYKVSKKVRAKLEYLKDKTIREGILAWKGLYVVNLLFYLYLFRKYKSKCIVFKDYNSSVIKMGVVIWVDTVGLRPETEMDGFTSAASMIAKCIKRGEKMVIIPLSLVLHNGGGHANVLVYRENGNIIEHFEPHGSNIRVDTGITKPVIDKKLGIFVSIINDEFKKAGLSPTVVLKPANEVCPHLRGLQSIEHLANETVLKDGSIQGDSGFCLAWCIFFKEMCLKNPTISSDMVFKSIYDTLNIPKIQPDKSKLKNPSKYLKQVIRGYSLFISEKIDKYFSFLYKEPLNIGTIKAIIEDPKGKQKINTFLRNIIFMEMQMLDNPKFDIEHEIVNLQFRNNFIHKFYSVNMSEKIKQLNEDKIFLYKNIDKLIHDSPVTNTPETPIAKVKAIAKVGAPLKPIPTNKTYKKDCPEGKIRNEKTGRCVNITKKRSNKPKPKEPTPPPPKEPTPIPEPIQVPVLPPKPAKKPKTIKDCPEGKVRNEKTGRCVNITKKRSNKPKPLVL